MRTKAAGTLFAIGFVLITGAAAVAQDPIQNLRVSSTSDGTNAAQSFPVGTEVLYAVFTYSELSDDRVSVTVEGRGVPQLATTTTRMSGSGVGSLEISGAMMYKSVTARLVGEAEVTRDNINRAANASVGLQEYLQQVLASVYTMQALTDYLADVPISEPLINQTATARAAVAEIEILADEALDLPQSDVAGRQAKADALKRPSATVLSAARQLDAGAASITTAPIAASPSPLDYSAQVSINALPSASVEFGISSDTRAFVPVILKRLDVRAEP